MKAAIFDLDGTLLDSMPVLKTAELNYVLTQGITPPANLHETLKTMSFRIAAEYLVHEFSLDTTPEEAMTFLVDGITRHYHTSIEPKPYVVEYLHKLKSQGVRMCVATATDKHLAEVALLRLGMLDFFEFVLTVDEVGKSKDFPDIFLDAARRMNCSPNQCVVFEDSLQAILSLQGTGFTIWGIYDASSTTELDQIQKYSNRYIWSFKDLLNDKED